MCVCLLCGNGFIELFLYFWGKALGGVIEGENVKRYWRINYESRETIWKNRRES